MIDLKDIVQIGKHVENVRASIPIERQMKHADIVPLISSIVCMYMSFGLTARTRGSSSMFLGSRVTSRTTMASPEELWSHWPY
jgi:hypothetical protein